MFTELVRIGCSFLACRNGLAKYQTCWLFYRPSITLYLDLASAHLETVLLWVSTACQAHFHSYPILLPSCLEELPDLSWLST